MARKAPLPIELGETGKKKVVLSAGQAELLAESDVLTVTPVRNSINEYWLSSKRKVGLIRIGDLEIRIEPKLSVRRLLFLASYATGGQDWRDDPVQFTSEKDLVAAAGHLLWRQVDRALKYGPLQGYRTLDESLYVMRGRLREPAQLSRQHGRCLPIEVRYDDYTPDIPENQILLAAVSRMVGVPRLASQPRIKLEAQRARLAAVASAPRGPRLPPWQPTRLNQHYHEAIALAEVICTSCSPEFGRGSVGATGFVFDLDRIFEQFVTVAFSEYLRERYGCRIRAQGTWYLDENKKIAIRPDLVCWLGGETIIVDAKYKPEKTTGRTAGGNPDLFQMLSYCTRFGASRGYLLFAKGNETPSRFKIDGAGVELVRAAVDLDQRPVDLLRRVRQIADEMVAGMGRQALTSSREKSVRPSRAVQPPG